MNTVPILKVENLRTYFTTGAGIARAVDGVTFSIMPGETYALVGESGCGKSVTALSILQLVSQPAGRIAGGSVILNGLEISSLPPIQMRKIRGNRISMIFQEPMTALNPVFTIGNQISEAVLLHQNMSGRQARKRAVEMLERVGIPDPAARYSEYPHQFSGGMRQRVMIAMALSCRPEVLIADEPTTALDVTIQAQILRLIKELQRELNTAVLLITHNMGVVRENADRVGVMYAGKIAEEASQNDLFSSPAHPYTQLLLRSLPSRADRRHPLQTIKGIVPKATEFPPGCRFSTRCPFVFARCRREQPQSYPVAEGHFAQCFLLDAQHPVANPGNVGNHKVPILGGVGGGSEYVATFMNQSDQPMKNSGLVVENLQMHFPIRKGLFKRAVGHVRAVDGVSIQVARAETLALVGESGCGKTTVAGCIVRLLEPTGGSIRFHDTELVGLSRRAMKPFRQKIQIIFQDPFSSLNPRLTIDRAITEGMDIHHIHQSRNERLEAARDLMTTVGMDADMMSRYPHEFSGGQRQRIGLARALAARPELLICDEATSSLDVSVQAQILNLLRKLQSELGLSYLFITHDLGVVKYLADRVCVMYLGRIVEEGSTAEIFENPLHPYTRALLAAVPQVDAMDGRRKIVLAGDVPSPVNPPAGCHFHTRCPHVKQECLLDYPRAVTVGAGHKCRCVLYY